MNEKGLKKVERERERERERRVLLKEGNVGDCYRKGGRMNRIHAPQSNQSIFVLFFFLSIL